MLPLPLSLWEASFRSMILELWSRSLKRFSDVYTAVDAEGQGLVEYALILVLVAVVVVVIMTLMGTALGNVFSNIVCGVFDAQNMACLN